MRTEEISYVRYSSSHWAGSASATVCLWRVAGNVIPPAIPASKVLKLFESQLSVCEIFQFVYILPGGRKKESDQMASVCLCLELLLILLLYCFVVAAVVAVVVAVAAAFNLTRYHSNYPWPHRSRKG